MASLTSHRKKRPILDQGTVTIIEAPWGGDFWGAAKEYR